MKILKSPQRNDTELTYQFNGEVITATLNGVSDTFDFTDMPEGKATDFDTALQPCPVKSAERDANGELWVELMNYIDATASESERFPEWETV